MSKFIISTLVALLGIIQAFVPASAFAAAKTIEEIGLTPNDVKNLTKDQIQGLLDSATVTYVDGKEPAADAATPLLPNTVNCFDNYSFGSVQANLVPSVSSAVSGSQITFSGNIVNGNAYPVVNGTLVVKIFKAAGNGQKNIDADDVVDEFNAVTNVNLPANGTLPVSVDWKIPAFLDSGSYKAVTFFVVAGKFNLLGLTFTDDIVGNTADFSVTGETGAVRFDKSTVNMNGGKFYFAAYPPRIADDQVKITATLVNTTSVEQTVPVAWQAYSWDAQHESNFIESDIQTVRVPANGKVETSHTVSDKANSVYYVRAVAESNGVKSIIGTRFVRPDANKLRINFPSIAKFPLVKGEKTDIFSCLHATNDMAGPADGKLVLTLKDKVGKVIHSYEYKGPVTSSMMGVKDSFVPDADYDELTLKAELYQGEALVDNVELTYDCKVIDPAACADNGMIIKIVLGIIAALAIVFILILAFKRKPKVTATSAVMMLLLAFGWTAFTSNTSAQNWWESAVLPGEARWEGTAPRMSTSWGGQRSELENVHIKVRYRTQIAKESGEALLGGETLTPGTKVKLKVLPYESNDIYWFGLGGVYDSPFGEWRAGSTPPAAGCQDKDYTSLGISGIPTVTSVYHRYMFFDLVMSPPTASIAETQNLDCGALVGGVATCSVVAEGPVKASFKFTPTTGKFYYSYFNRKPFEGLANPKPLSQVSAADRAACLAQTEEFGGYTVSVPEITKPYTFVADADPENQPPTVPVVTGTGWAKPGQSYSFSSVSTDPDGDQIRYAVDFDSNGITDTSLPGSGYVSSGAAMSTSKSWAALGTYTIKVKAEDTPGGLSSGWATHQVIVSEEDPFNGVTPPTNNPIDGKCVPGSDGCRTSCGDVAPIERGRTLTISTPGLCSADAVAMSPGTTLTGFTWKCQGAWQTVPQNCNVACETGIYSPIAGACADSVADYCPNLDGDQTDASKYDIVKDPATGVNRCMPKASIKYFKFSPDQALENCPAYWDTELPDASLKFSTVCKINGGATVPGKNLLPGGAATFLQPVGRLHSLTCAISDLEGVAKTLTSVARCYRIGEQVED